MPFECTFTLCLSDRLLVVLYPVYKLLYTIFFYQVFFSLFRQLDHNEISCISESTISELPGMVYL